jgi:hypothetical protein
MKIDEQEITSLNEEIDNVKKLANADHADLTLKNQNLEIISKNPNHFGCAFGFPLRCTQPYVSPT